MATYALQVLILYVMNEHHLEIKTPLDVFRKFFQVFGRFEWDKYILTLYGPIEKEGFYESLMARNNDAEALALEQRESRNIYGHKLKIKPGDLKEI